MERLKLMLLTLLLIVLTTAHCCAHPVDRFKRQTRSWTVTEWSECTATCNGGIRVRSVRCLDEDGVIAQDCNADSRPDTFEFCNQVDCDNPDLPLPDALPASGDYNLTSPDGASHSVRFDSSPGGSYTLEKSTTETDGTISSFTQTANVTSVRTSTGFSGRGYNLGVQFTDGLLFLAVDGDGLIALNGIQSTEISSSQTFTYSGDTITISNGSSFQNVSTLYFYDGFLFYRFNGSKINDLSGPGKIYVNSGVALYSTNPSLTSQLDGLILTVPVDPENPESPESPEPTQGPSPSASSIVSSLPTTSPPLSTSPTPVSPPLLPSPDVSRPTVPTRSRPRPQTQQPPEDSKSRTGSRPGKSKPHKPSPPDRPMPGAPRNESTPMNEGTPKSRSHSEDSKSRSKSRRARPDNSIAVSDVTPPQISTPTKHSDRSDSRHAPERPEHTHSEGSKSKKGSPGSSHHGSSRQPTSANPNRRADSSRTHLSSKDKESHHVTKRRASLSRKLVKESTEVSPSSSQPDPSPAVSKSGKHNMSNDQLSTTNTTNFTFSFQSSVVSLVSNGNELLTLTGAQTQTVPSDFIILYQNNSVIIHGPIEEDNNFEMILGLEELTTFDGFQLNSYAGSAPLEIVGGGQIYVSGNKAFYSTDDQLNMQINGILRSAVPTPTSPSASPSVTPHPLQPNFTSPEPDRTTKPTELEDRTTKPTEPEDRTTKPTEPEDATTKSEPKNRMTKPVEPEDRTTKPVEPEDGTTKSEPKNRMTKPDLEDRTMAKPDPKDRTTTKLVKPDCSIASKHSRPLTTPQPRHYTTRHTKEHSNQSESTRNNSQHIKPQPTRHSKVHSKHTRPASSARKDHSKILKPEPIRHSKKAKKHSQHVNTDSTMSRFPRHPRQHAYRRSFVVRPLPPSSSQSPASMMIPVPGIPGVELEINQTDGRVTLYNCGMEVIEFTEAFANYIPEMQTIEYTNATIIFLNRDKQLLEKISNIDSFTIFDGHNLFEVSSPSSITGGGMFYQSGQKAFFSSSSSLNGDITNAMEEAPQGIKFEFLLENNQFWLLFNGSLIIELTNAKIRNIPHQHEITYNGNTISINSDTIEGIEYLAIFYGTQLETPSMFAFTRVKGGGVIVISNNTALYSLSDPLNSKIAEVLRLPAQEDST